MSAISWDKQKTMFRWSTVGPDGRHYGGYELTRTRCQQRLAEIVAPLPREDVTSQDTSLLRSVTLRPSGIPDSSGM